MVPYVWLGKAKSRTSRKVRDDGFFLSEQEFHHEVARERVRSDRNRSPLAVLVIELPADRSTDCDFAFLANVLQGRLRITDRAGYLVDRRVAVLLPDTLKPGAWKVASDICDLYPVGLERPSCEVYVYPDESSRSDDDWQQHDKELVGDNGARLNSLFVHPTPKVKRALDVLGASAGLVIAAPVLLLMAAVIKLTSPGPILYSQFREGHGGRRFRIYKLRSMRVGAHQQQSTLRAFSVQDGPAFKMKHDPRTTWIGRFLRKSSLDELPQLWNVLKGDMSLVGPRPLPVDESLQCAPWQRRRLAVVPGMTCVWQVKGRSSVSFEDWMRMDLEYLRHRSLTYDVRILLRTIPSLVSQQGPR